jgi:hypothetical protein
MLNLEDFKKKTLSSCTDISIKGIILCTKPIAKVMRYIVDMNKLNHQSLINTVVDSNHDKQPFNSYLEQLRLSINSSHESLKSRGFSFNKITRDKPKEIKIESSKELKVSIE